jgi:hypothetical protein
VVSAVQKTVEGEAACGQAFLAHANEEDAAVLEMPELHLRASPAYAVDDMPRKTRQDGLCAEKRFQVEGGFLVSLLRVRQFRPSCDRHWLARHLRGAESLRACVVAASLSHIVSRLRKLEVRVIALFHAGRLFFFF